MFKCPTILNCFCKEQDIILNIFRNITTYKKYRQNNLFKSHYL